MDSIVTIPGGFRIDGKLVREIEIREMTGVEEDIIADQRRVADGSGKFLKPYTDRITEILARCTIRIGDKVHEANADPERATPKVFAPMWANALAGDRSYAAVALRSMSLGTMFVFKEICQKCDAEIPRVELDLKNAEISPYFKNIEKEVLKSKGYSSFEEVPEEEVGELKAEIDKLRDDALLKETHTIRLPSGRSADWHLLTGADELRLSEEMESDKSKDKFVTALVCARINRIDDKKVESLFDRSVRMLPARDRQFLMSYFDEVEGGIDMTYSVFCNRCSHTFIRFLNINKPSFFIPSGAK